MNHEPVEPGFYKGCILAFVMMLVAISISMAFCSQCQAQALMVIQ